MCDNSFLKRVNCKRVLTLCELSVKYKIQDEQKDNPVRVRMEGRLLERGKIVHCVGRFTLTIFRGRRVGARRKAAFRGRRVGTFRVSKGFIVLLGRFNVINMQQTSGSRVCCDDGFFRMQRRISFNKLATNRVAGRLSQRNTQEVRTSP